MDAEKDLEHSPQARSPFCTCALSQRLAEVPAPCQCCPIRFLCTNRLAAYLPVAAQVRALAAGSPKTGAAKVSRGPRR